MTSSTGRNEGGSFLCTGSVLVFVNEVWPVESAFLGREKASAAAQIWYPTSGFKLGRGRLRSHR